MAETTEHLFEDGAIQRRLRISAEGLEGLAEAIADERPSAHLVGKLLAEARLLQRRTVGVIAALTSAALENEKQGAGPVVEDVLGAGGTVGRQDTRVEVERARVASRFPAVAKAVTSGSVHTGNLDVLARLTSRMSEPEVDALAERDARLADAASRLSEDSFRKRVQRMRDRVRADHGRTASEQALADSFARISPNHDRAGYRVAALLDPLRGSAVQAALDREYRWLVNHSGEVDGMNADQAMAQALHDLILRGDATDRQTATARANVNVLVLTDRQTLTNGPHDETVAETADGMALAPETIGRLCCDAALRRLDLTPDAQVHVSHSGRTATLAQKAALRAMYDGCPISGAPWSQCEVHHTVFYRESGRTVLSELVPISRRWHHLVHEGGWTLTMDAERTLHLSRPDGTHHQSVPFVAAHLRPRATHVLAA